VAFILYDRLLPNMVTSNDDLELFQQDPVEYIRKYFIFLNKGIKT